MLSPYLATALGGFALGWWRACRHTGKAATRGSNYSPGTAMTFAGQACRVITEARYGDLLRELGELRRGAAVRPPEPSTPPPR